MNIELISKSLCFHGQPLQKIWEGERGNHDLARLGINNPDYSIYMARQKTLTFQDRAKRLKLHQFVARNAPILFDSNLIEDIPTAKRKDKTNAFPVVMPPYEAFLSKSIDKNKNLAEVLEAIQPGEIVYGQVMSRTGYGIVVKILCTGEPLFRYLGDVGIKAYVVTQNLVPAYDKKGNAKTYSTNDYVCCEVLDLSADADRMVLGMKGTLTIDPKAPLGLITAEQLPEYYKILTTNENAEFEELLEKSKAFQNPNCVDLLFQENGLDPNEISTHLTALRNRFPQQEYATELRQIQASKWAFRSVADGIEHFKVGRHSEAFQCLNKALNIDPRNVEGLVARGALYANSGSFKKAVDDFETALKLNPYHANARKYMGETLVALGRSYEEENRMEEARKAYMDCLNIIPHHEDAKSSLEFLNGKMSAMQGKQLIDANELSLPGNVERKDTAEKDKKKKKNRKRKNTSSTSDSSDSDSNSSDSSSSSESSSSTSDSDSSDGPSSSAKLKKKNHRQRKKSLSPISKRMALMEEQNSPSNATRYNFNQPFHLATVPGGASGATNRDDYDSKVRNFLNVSQEDEDYESRVRHLIEKATKHRKDRKVDEKKEKKKEKKKQKKMKKESKKEKRRKSKTKINNTNNTSTELSQLENMELKEALKILKTLPVSSTGSKSVQDDLNECQKYEQIVELLQKRKDLPSSSKDQQIPGPKPAYPQYHQQQQSVAQQYENPRNTLIQPATTTTIRKPHTSAAPPVPVAVKRPTTPPPAPPIVVERPRLPAPIQIMPAKQSVVLDKFGSFRLAAFDDSKDLLAFNRKSNSPSPRRRYSRSLSRTPSRYRSRRRSPSSTRSNRRSRSPRRRISRSPRRSRSRRRSRSARRSRSRSFVRSRSRDRRRRSFSRSRRSRSRSIGAGGGVRKRFSRSPVRRRSRSESVERRWRSSRSRSFSSRSGSRSPDSMRRGGRRRGGGGSYYRGGSRGFGRGFRGGRGSRGGRGRGGGGFRGGRRSPYFNRRSPLNTDRAGSKGRNGSSDRSDDDEAKRKRKDRSSDGIDGKWTHDKYEKSRTDNFVNDEENWDAEAATVDTGGGGDASSGSAAVGASVPIEPSVEEIEKIIGQAQKERKEEILQRDKDLLKKPIPTNLPF